MGFPINEKFTEGTSVISAVNTASVTTAVLSLAADMGKLNKLTAYFTAGALATAETITCTLLGCATSGGSYVAITGASATLLKSAPDDNKTTILEISAESLNALGLSYRYVKASVAGAVGSPVCVTVIGATGREEPVSSLNTATVKAILVI